MAPRAGRVWWGDRAPVTTALVAAHDRRAGHRDARRACAEFLLSRRAPVPASHAGAVALALPEPVHDPLQPAGQVARYVLKGRFRSSAAASWVGAGRT